MPPLPDATLLWYVIGYGIIITIIGMWYSRKITSSEDFVLAGKTLGPMVLTGTLLATFSGSGTITGGSNAIAYAYGFWPAVYVIILPGMIGMGVLLAIAPKIRSHGEYTVARILQSQFGTTARRIASVIIILAYVGIVSYQFKGIGFVLNVTTGVSVKTGTATGAVLIVVLAAMGGLMAVAPTDALSAFLMVIGLALSIPALLDATGGLTAMIQALPAGHLSPMGHLSPVQILGDTIPFLFLLMGDQNIYQRLAASRGEKAARGGIIGWIMVAVFVFTAVPFIATTARALFPHIDPGMALIATTRVMPTLLGGILLAAAAAFIVTTGNSYLLSAATSVAYDVYADHINPDASEKELLGVTKLSIPLLGLAAWVLLNFFPSVLQIQMLAYVIYSAGVTPAVLSVFLWKGVTRAGGIASMVTGVVATTAWEILKPYDVVGSVVAVPLAIVVLVAVSKRTAAWKNR